MDLFVNLYKSSLFFNYNLLPKYTYYDLYIRSLNMAYRFKEDKHKYVLLFLPNCIEYIECIFACVMANVNSLHCTYNNILKHILLPDIDIIVTTKSNLHLINTLLDKCNDTIVKDIRSKMIIVTGHLNGEDISTVPMVSDQNILELYKHFINNSTQYFIFPSNSHSNTHYDKVEHTKIPHQFLKASVQYIQYHSYYYKNRYRKQTTFTLFPYDLNTLNGIICMFNIINNWECIIDLDAHFRYGEEYLENYLLPFNNIHVDISKRIVNVHINDDELNKYNMFFDKKSNTIRMSLTKDFYSTNYIHESVSKELIVRNTNSNPYSYITIFGITDNITNMDTNMDTNTDTNKYIISKKYSISNFRTTTIETLHNSIISKSTKCKDSRTNFEKSSKTKNKLEKYDIHNNLESKNDFEMISKFRKKFEMLHNHKSTTTINSILIYTEVLPFRINISHFFSIQNRLNDDPTLVLNLRYIPIKGISMVEISKQITKLDNNLIIVWLLSDRKTLVYTYSYFSKNIHKKVHNLLLNEIYRINNVEIKNYNLESTNKVKDWNEFKKRRELDSKYSTWKSLFPIKLFEMLYIIIYIIQYTVNVIKNKVDGIKGIKNNVKLLQDYDKQDQIYYNCKTNVSILTREQTSKLYKLCKKENIKINDLIQVACVNIIKKLDDTMNVYCKRKINSIDTCDYVHVSHIGPVTLMDSNFENIFLTYIRMFGKVRFWMLKKISDACTIKKNNIYINCDESMCPTTEPLFTGSMLNTVGVTQFFIADGQLTCNTFGIKVNGFYLVFTAMLNKIKEYLNILLM